MIKSNHNGFTLVELLIVVAIVAILASIAIPSYQSHMQKTRRAEGQAALLEALNTQERYYTLNNTYVTDLTTLGYSASPAPTENNYYTISAAACGSGIASCVTLTATAGTAQAADGNLTLNSLGVKTPTAKW